MLPLLLWNRDNNNMSDDETVLKRVEKLEKLIKSGGASMDEIERLKKKLHDAVQKNKKLVEKLREHKDDKPKKTKKDTNDADDAPPKKKAKKEEGGKKKTKDGEKKPKKEKKSDDEGGAPRVCKICLKAVKGNDHEACKRARELIKRQKAEKQKNKEK